MDTIDPAAITGIVISSVVPPLDSTLRQVCERYFRRKPLFIEPGVKTGMPVHYDNPAEVGADRVVNGVAAFAKYGGPRGGVGLRPPPPPHVISPQSEELGGVLSPPPRLLPPPPLPPTPPP